MSAPSGVRYAVGDSDARPWGRWTVIDSGPTFTVKRIEVNPGAKLSLQLHHARHEHWIIVAGRARVVNGDKILDLGANDGAFIPLGARHRIENIGDAPLVFIEVQYGEHLSEDDIVRLEDSYGRA